MWYTIALLSSDYNYVPMGPYINILRQMVTSQKQYPMDIYSYGPKYQLQVLRKPHL